MVFKVNCRGTLVFFLFKYCYRFAVLIIILKFGLSSFSIINAFVCAIYRHKIIDTKFVETDILDVAFNLVTGKFFPN